MGGSPTRLDGIEKVTGASKYAADIRVPGMLYARILRPPMHGGTLLHLDTSGAEHLPGITLVNQGDLVAALHADPEAAANGFARIKADWQLPEARLNPETIYDHLLMQAAPLKTLSERGELAAVRASAAHLFETTYQKGYVAHAALEPHAALAEIKEGKATVWASTQTPFPTRDRIAKALGLDPKRVRVITPFLGGGFGGKSADSQAIEAARLAQITGRPVQVAWTRPEEFFYDHFDPASVVDVASGIDEAGKIVLWDASVHAAGDRGASLFYDAPNVRLKVYGQTSYSDRGGGVLHPFAVGPWRAPGANMNAFAMESQIDLMAAAARVDPLEFRLRNLTDVRMRRVLQAAGDG